MDIIGGGNSAAELQEYVNSVGAQDCIRFIGQVNSESIPETLSKYDLGIAFVPDNGHFGVAPSLKTIDYMQAGLPIAATATLGHRDFAQEYKIHISYFSDGQSLADIFSDKRFLAYSESRINEYIEALEKLSYSKLVQDIVLPTYAKLKSEKMPLTTITEGL
ncbi:hypothetical protein GCM10027297_21520 [Parahaliea aestuarii]